MECIIPQKYHRTVMGAKGMKVQEITREFDVGIKFPDRPSEAERKKLNMCIEIIDTLINSHLGL